MLLLSRANPGAKKLFDPKSKTRSCFEESGNALNGLPLVISYCVIRNLQENFSETNAKCEPIFLGNPTTPLAQLLQISIYNIGELLRSVERFESVAPSYARAGYFLGLNGHIRAHVKSHPDWSKEDYVKLAHQFVEMEIEAHQDLAGPPISELEIDENGDVHWLDKGACDSREFGGTIRARMGK